MMTPNFSELITEGDVDLYEEGYALLSDNYQEFAKLKKMFVENTGVDRAFIVFEHLRELNLVDRRAQALSLAGAPRGAILSYKKSKLS